MGNMADGGTLASDGERLENSSAKYDAVADVSGSGFGDAVLLVVRADAKSDGWFMTPGDRSMDARRCRDARLSSRNWIVRRASRMLESA